MYVARQCPVCLEIENSSNIPKPPFHFYNNMQIDFDKKQADAAANQKASKQPAASARSENTQQTSSSSASPGKHASMNSPKKASKVRNFVPGDVACGVTVRIQLPAATQPSTANKQSAGAGASRKNASGKQTSTKSAASSSSYNAIPPLLSSYVERKAQVMGFMIDRNKHGWVCVRTMLTYNDVCLLGPTNPHYAKLSARMDKHHELVWPKLDGSSTHPAAATAALTSSLAAPALTPITVNPSRLVGFTGVPDSPVKPPMLSSISARSELSTTTINTFTTVDTQQTSATQHQQQQQHANEQHEAVCKSYEWVSIDNVVNYFHLYFMPAGEFQNKLNCKDISRLNTYFVQQHHHHHHHHHHAGGEQQPSK
jgi:hypothetical protein